MDKIWNYKNFNMVYELDVAGEFIYDGIQTLNQMNSISIGAPIFSFLYHLSVGIERLQKIILVLFEDITLENYEEFEKSLITHSHGYLHERISKKVNVDFNSRENEFLTLLSTFYNHSRYNRFNFNASLNQEKELLEEYILKYINEKSINRRQEWDQPGFTVTMYSREISSQNNVHPGRKIGKDANGNNLYGEKKKRQI